MGDDMACDHFTQAMRDCLVASILAVMPAVFLAVSGDKRKRSAMVGYWLCSSGLLAFNAVLVSRFPYPFLVLGVQGFFTASVAGAVSLARFDDAGRCDPPSRAAAMSFAPCGFVFVGLAMLTMKVLQATTVAAFFVVRAASPFVLHVVGCYFLRTTEELPHRSWLSLAGLLAAAGLYAFAAGRGAGLLNVWLGLWVLAFLFDHLYVKRVFDSYPMSVGGRVFLGNAFVALQAVLGAPFLDPPERAIANGAGPCQYFEVAAALAGSCVLGALLAYFAARLRDDLSPVAFAHVGNMSKLAALAVNGWMWGDGTSACGVIALFAAVTAGACFRDAEKVRVFGCIAGCNGNCTACFLSARNKQPMLQCRDEG